MLVVAPRKSSYQLKFRGRLHKLSARERLRARPRRPNRGKAAVLLSETEIVRRQAPRRKNLNT